METIDFEIVSVPIVARRRKIKAGWKTRRESNGDYVFWYDPSIRDHMINLGRRIQAICWRLTDWINNRNQPND
jgi:hypothetical protein